jgi:hypothetical protein
LTTAVVVRPLPLPPYAGNASRGLLPSTAERLRTDLEASVPAFDFEEEGAARVNGAPGYQLAYQSREGDRRTLARDVLLLPDDEGSEGGVLISLRQTVRGRGPLGAGGKALLADAKSAFRSLRFGTERP